VAVPSTVLPWPAGHVACAAHALAAVMLVLAVSLNCPAAQSVHVRSREVVAVTFVYVPAAQKSLDGMQELPSAVSE
jgi:hypothetical protein